MRAAVDAAHALGMKVAAHIYPAGASEAAVRAGGESGEHGAFATAQTFALMKARGTYLVPTRSVYDIFYKVALEHPELPTPGTPAKEIANDPLPKRNLPLAIRSGVKLAYGTDIGEGDHGLEFGLLIANGMRPIDAILAATRNGADIADAPAISGKPLEREVASTMEFGVAGNRLYNARRIPLVDALRQRIL